MAKLASRQVHLDFHTSEFMPGVGAAFSKENFQEALRIGNLNSITVFAKCHHSWSYYPTEAGMMHPTQDPEFDLTGAMIEAGHEIGVRVPVYITVGWSANDAENHPEWVVRRKDGSMDIRNGRVDAPSTDARPIVSWKTLCPNGSYADLIYAQTREVCERYPVLDGLFFDICFGPTCYCDACLEGMQDAGWDPKKEADAQAYNVAKWQRFMTRCTEILHAKHPEATIFFNGGAEPTTPQWHAWQTHFEMEDLPTTWGGYDKMPARAKFFARSGKEYLGMTGKFHTMWGEFGGFKPADAMRFECAAMLAYGAKCSIGDQMHPCGEMDLETYRLIGEAYRYVESIEPWSFDETETSRLGIVLSGDSKSDEGLVRMLLEKQLDFDIAFLPDDLSRFDTIVLPDSVQVDDTEAAALREYVDAGGSMVLTGTSGLNAGRSQFLVDVGANYQGAANYENDYLRLGSDLSSGLITSPFLVYEGAEQVWVTDGEVLASLHEPYFNRTYGHYCSHQNTPYRTEQAQHPGALRKGRVVYLAHPICRIYYDHGSQFHRDYFINALRLVYRDPILQVGMPSCGRVRLAKQPQENRYVLHLLYAAPLQRGRTAVIDDLPPIYDIPVTVKIDEPIRQAYLAPEMEPIAFDQAEGRVQLTVPKVECHQIVVLEL